MRRSLLTFAFILPLAACGGGDDWFGGGSSQSGSTGTTASTPSTPTASSQTGQAGSTRTMSGTTGMGATTAAASRLTAAEQSFIIGAAEDGMAEVELSRLAQQKASSSSVRDFGRRMVQDHTQANQELMGIAQRNGINPPSEMSDAAKAAKARLEQASGSDFDRQYMEQMAADHEASHAKFQFAATHARNPELRAFAQRTDAVIQQHMALLRQISPTAMRSGM